MKNLDLWDVSVKDLSVDSEENFILCFGHNDDNSSNELYICTHNLIVINFDENGSVKWKKDLSEVASSENRPVNVTFLTLTNALCVGLANGEIYTISDLGNNCDLVGVCEPGLLAMEWSPDQELLVLITREYNTILMSSMFDPIHEVGLSSEEFGEKQFITVGWGKKETQFHGSEGKQAAKMKNEVGVDSNTASDISVKVTWRGDGNLYAIGFTMDGIRRFKVFDREGHLQYTSEKHQGLEANLSWRPIGNVIATTQKLSNKYTITFFEKNGLKHGGFTIPVNSTTNVIDLAWSSDSEILALQCIDIEDNTQKVLLFTTSNYHWYLKQTLSFNSQQKIRNIMWDNDFDVMNNKKLHIILQNGQLFSYSWIWNIDHSKGRSDIDDAVVTVIDGEKALLTGFRQTVVPPPMAALEINVGTFINSIHFISHVQQNQNSNVFFLCTSDYKLIFYEQVEKLPLQYKVFKTVYLDSYDYPFQYYNWYWVSYDIIICIKVDNNKIYSLIECAVDSDKLIKKKFIHLPAAVTRIQSHPTKSSTVFLQLINGDVLQYDVSGIIEPQNVSFSVSCPQFSVLSIDDNLLFLGLSHKGNMYIDDTMIMNNVSSFFVHTHFLLLTTLQHVLLCIELTKIGLNSLIEYDKSESAHVYKRKIERGAKLVIAVPHEMRTIFQLPRGNLETIQPRPLSLKVIGEYLDSLKYSEAFDLMRKQRINLNLIYDHDPEKFVKYIDIFLEKIKNNSWLSLFLSDLENVDVTKTMYCSSYAERKDQIKEENNKKIETICDIVKTHLMMKSDRDSKILPLLTSFVKKNTIKDLESALSLIKQLKLKESAGFKLPVSCDEALKYLLYMVDVNHLFDVAFGMYDFDLVLLVANKSQKDPKEYIPMLNELNQMDENYKRFTINKHLKRFDRAVECLAKCGVDQHAELRKFVKYHSLYREALPLFSPDDNIYKEISDDFGHYLKLKKQFIEAGIVYEKANNIEKAVECYKEALEWELAIKLAYKWPKEQFIELCWDLITALKEEKRHKEALSILEQFTNDQKATIIYAIENGQYKTALRLCAQYDKTDLRDNHLLPVLLEEHKNLQDIIESNWTNFIKYKNRLHIVRENKRKNPMEIYDPSYANKDSDLYSDVGSTVASSASRSSKRTFRSSKNRRKHERKVASLKEGSQYEDVALVMALHNLITYSFELRPQVREINIALSWFDKNKEVFLLQKNLEKILMEMKQSFQEIWTNELVIEATNASIAAQSVPEGSSIIAHGIAALEPHIRIAPVIQDINWKFQLH